ncbi:PAS domain-containing protein [Desulfopila sp. IMCC35006]|uniref:methyl-accepting chemotaxis protein n=1 Tax=Desulfopila sp. IMCC35006 TaxID=2569542 RepID=UPI0010AC994E|nr:PAS domain-containing protein [Desulfopila sp. IMCC35006]TKB23329.1 PAS domain-containing protein [Desulfopila sp. IMCC35006]
MEKKKNVQVSEQDGSCLNLLMEPSYIVDEKKVITWANQAFFDRFNLTGDAVINKITCEESCPTQLCGTKDCPVDKSRRIAKPVSAEVIYRDGENGLTFFTSKAIPMNGSGSTFVKLDDISDLKQTQAQLRQLSTDLDVIPTPIMEIDTKFTITFMNPAGAAVAGLTVDEVVGKKCYDLFKTPHCKTEKCACARAMKTDSVVTEQTIARPRDGVIIPIKYTGAPIKDAKGNIKGALEYILDMTEETKQKQMADEKIENLNTLPTPVLAIDTDYAITFINPAGAAVLGTTPDELIGKKCYDMFKTPHCRTEKCACSRAMRTDSVVTEQTIARPAEGVIIPIKYTGAPIKDAKGNIKGALEFVLDTTEENRQKQAADEKIENLNTIPTPIMSIDTDFTITFMNPAGAAVVGSTPDQVLGKKCFDLFKTPHCKTEKCACARAMKTDSVITETTIARPAEGVIIPIKYTGAPIKDAKGNIKGALEYVLDMTEEAKQKQAADEKIENLNTIPTPIMSIDTDFTITFMNPAGAAVVGSTPDQVIGKKCYDLFKTPHCKTEKCACARAMKTDSVVTEHTIARPAEGVIIPIKYTGAPIKDAKGNIKGALEYVLDMTEEAKQKQAADEKIENLNTIPTPIMSIDTDYTVTFMNPAGAAAVGSTPDQTIGKKCYDLFKTDHCRTEKCACSQAMHTDRVVHAQATAHPNGKDMPIKYTASPIKDAKGNIKGALEYITDVTAEKAVEKLINEAVEDVDTLVNASKHQMVQADQKVDEMNSLIDQEAKQLQESLKMVKEMVANSSEMLNLSTESNQLATDLSREAETGKAAGKNAEQKLVEINSTMQKNNEMVGGLVNKLEKISGFVDIIKDIASKTNLLAFNAAIEAARAGDAGRGFAVVADEVRKLAENSSKSAIDISDIVKQVEKDSLQTITAMQSGMTMLDDGGKVINTALDSMETISRGITVISGAVGNLSQKSKDLCAGGQNVMTEIESVAVSAKENQQSISVVNQSLTETVGALDRLVQSNKNLQDAVQNL